MKMATTKLAHAFAVVLVKCKLGEENAIRQIVTAARKGHGQGEFHLSLRIDDDHECAREKVIVISTAYCFAHSISCSLCVAVKFTSLSGSWLSASAAVDSTLRTRIRS